MDAVRWLLIRGYRHGVVDGNALGGVGIGSGVRCDDFEITVVRIDDVFEIGTLGHLNIGVLSQFFERCVLRVGDPIPLLSVCHGEQVVANSGQADCGFRSGPIRRNLFDLFGVEVHSSAENEDQAEKSECTSHEPECRFGTSPCNHFFGGFFVAPLNRYGGTGSALPIATNCRAYATGYAPPAAKEPGSPMAPG